ncbi:hypothetical protein GGE07_005652 [Sinorhizobium terangae]|nr:hypothetical protein [Sinorhizobium terangae]
MNSRTKHAGVAARSLRDHCKRSRPLVAIGLAKLAAVNSRRRWERQNVATLPTRHWVVPPLDDARLGERLARSWKVATTFP